MLLKGVAAFSIFAAPLPSAGLGGWDKPATDRSVEDAVQTVDFARELRRVFIAFDGPPRAMGHSPESDLKLLIL